MKTSLALDDECPECVAVDGVQHQCDVEHNEDRPLHGNLAAGIVWGNASKPIKYKYYDEPYRELIRRAISGSRKSVDLPVQRNLEGDINDFLRWIAQRSIVGRVDIGPQDVAEYVRLKENS